jgi:hypothetical protein
VVLLSRCVALSPLRRRRPGFLIGGGRVLTPAGDNRRAEAGTTAIRTGQTITVDGTKGFVYLDGHSASEAATTSTAW